MKGKLRMSPYRRAREELLSGRTSTRIQAMADLEAAIRADQRRIDAEQAPGDEELTREELQDLVDELGTQAYRAGDLIDFVREMCDAADRDGSQVTTERVRGWLQYTGCGGVIVLPEGALKIWGEGGPDCGMLPARPRRRSEAVQRRVAERFGLPLPTTATQVSETASNPFNHVFQRQGPGGQQQWLWRCDGVQHCQGDMAVGYLTDDTAASGYQQHVAEKHGPEPTAGQLHARRQHPGWEYATTEGPRKQWDDQDVPPYDSNGDPDPTWERNTDAGRDGWERFDYTEESYWRRPKPVADPAAGEDPQ